MLPYQDKETATVRVLEKDESIIKDLDVCRIGMSTGKRENTIWELRDLLRVNHARESDYAISEILGSEEGILFYDFSMSTNKTCSNICLDESTDNFRSFFWLSQ